jgi:hypothetical protein
MPMCSNNTATGANLIVVNASPQPQQAFVSYKKITQCKYRAAQPAAFRNRSRNFNKQNLPGKNKAVYLSTKLVE